MTCGADTSSLQTASGRDGRQTPDFEKMLADVTAEVFECMVMMAVEPGLPSPDRPAQIRDSVSAIIGLSGGLRGMLAVHCPDALAREICGAMLGETPAEVDADVRDTIGEIANMLAGGLKTRLLNEGCDMEIAVPSVVAGSCYEVNLLSRAECLLLPMAANGKRFLLEFKYMR